MALNIPIFNAKTTVLSILKKFAMAFETGIY